MAYEWKSTAIGSRNHAVRSDVQALSSACGVQVANWDAWHVTVKDHQPCRTCVSVLERAIPAL